MNPASGPEPPTPSTQPSGGGHSNVDTDSGGGMHNSEPLGPAASDELQPPATSDPRADVGASSSRRRRPEPTERPWNAKVNELLALIDQLEPSSLEDQELALGLIRQLVEQHLRTRERQREDGDAPGR